MTSKDNLDDMKKLTDKISVLVKEGGLRKALFSDEANELLSFKGKEGNDDYVDFKDNLVTTETLNKNSYICINLYDFYTKFSDLLSTFISGNTIVETDMFSQNKFYEKKNRNILYLRKNLFDDERLRGKEFKKSKKIDSILNLATDAIETEISFSSSGDDNRKLSGNLVYNTLFYFNLTSNLKIVFTGNIKFGFNKSDVFIFSINVQEKFILDVAKDDFGNLEAHIIKDAFQYEISSEDEQRFLSDFSEMIKSEKDENGAIELMFDKGVFDGDADFINVIMVIKTFLYLRNKEENYSLFEGLFSSKEKLNTFSKDFKSYLGKLENVNEVDGKSKDEKSNIFGPDSIVLSGDEDSLKELMKKESFVEELKGYVPKRTISKLKSLSRSSRNMDVRDRDYINTLFSIPFGYYSELNLDINHFREKMNNEIYGMDVIKEHIVDQLAVFARSKSKRPNILCLSGPPGVGKTMICQIIAESINRKYDMISCSGMSEAFSLIGSHITYGNPQCGLIIKALIKSETMNPLILLDEIDKTGTSSHNGSVQDALIAILDQEQNNKFVDRFIDIPVDLSQIQFIATVNDINAISEPLRNRMAVIEVPGYNEEEKFDILKKHIMPSVFDEYNIKEDEIEMSDEAIRQFIDEHGSEPGVRELKRTFKNFMARIVNKLESGEEKIVVNDIKDIQYVGSDTKNRIGFV